MLVALGLELLEVLVLLWGRDNFVLHVISCSVNTCYSIHFFICSLFCYVNFINRLGCRIIDLCKFSCSDYGHVLFVDVLYKKSTFVVRNSFVLFDHGYFRFDFYIF
jgi:hypothetical protein